VDVVSDELETLRQQNQSLKEQVKLLVKTERRLDKSQKELQRQLKGINAMTEFALTAGAESDVPVILARAFETVFGLFALDQAVAYIVDGSGRLVPMVVHAASGLEGHSVERLAASTLALTVADTDIPDEPLVFKTSDKQQQCPALIPLLAGMDELFAGAVEESDGPDLSLSVIFPLQRKDGTLLGMTAMRKIDPASKSFHEELPTKKDVSFLQIFRNNLESVLDNALLAAERQRAREEQQRLARELEIATQIQQSMLPTHAPSIPGLDIAFHFKPADEVGGDYYDLLPVGDNHLAVAVGDVNGHGLGAALLMAMAKSSLHTQAGKDPSVVAVMAGLNDMIYSATTERRFMTFVYALIDLNTRTMVAANAGHPFPYRRFGVDGVVAPVETPPVYPLGVRRKGKYVLHESHMQTGDVLVFYSDGIIEGRNPEGEDFGFDRFEHVIRDHGQGTADEIRDELLRAFAEFDGKQDDDITLLVIKFANVAGADGDAAESGNSEAL
jgi:serine phosphatase RsbU (regulator of sigma subunit)